VLQREATVYKTHLQASQHSQLQFEVTQIALAAVPSCTTFADCATVS